MSLPTSGAAATASESPLAIGGVGGSGTRVVAAAAIALGVDMGSDLNPALDNLAFTLLFRARDVPDLPPAEFGQRVRLLVASARGTPIDGGDDRALLRAISAADRGGVHTAAWLQARAGRLVARAPGASVPPERWGWKEPNTHIVLPRLLEALPRMRYVHVVRNGLDMAFSTNRNQLAFWGPRLLGRPVRIDPVDALAYWCEVHRRVQRASATMGSRFLWLDHDALCSDPDAGMARLVEFLGLPSSLAPGLAPLVRPQPTSGRRRSHPIDGFAPRDLAYLEEIGHL
jgi:hypothetical protein